MVALMWCCSKNSVSGCPFLQSALHGLVRAWHLVGCGG